MLKAGEKAPEFKLESTGGGEVSLKALRGKKVVLYFYPKDNTPGCTKEACDFRDEQAALKKAGAVVFGVSKDKIDSHHKFKERFKLSFELLSDPDLSVARAYGAYGKKTMFGVSTTGMIRSTFLIDENGVVQAVWPKVKVIGHADEVLAALQS